MGSPDRQIDGLAGTQVDVLVVQRHPAGTLNNEPVLRPWRVFWVPKPLARQHVDPLDFVVRAFLEHGVAAPGPAVEEGRVTAGNTIGSPLCHRRSISMWLRTAK